MLSAQAALGWPGTHGHFLASGSKRWYLHASLVLGFLTTYSSDCFVVESKFLKNLKITQCLTNVWSGRLYSVF